jgi:hypothetical protein
MHSTMSAALVASRIGRGGRQPMLAIAACISAGDTSFTGVASIQWCPKGSVNEPVLLQRRWTQRTSARGQRNTRRASKLTCRPRIGLSPRRQA